MKRILIFLFLLISVLLSGCITQEEQDAIYAKKCEVYGEIHEVRTKYNPTAFYTYETCLICFENFGCITQEQFESIGKEQITKDSDDLSWFLLGRMTRY